MYAVIARGEEGIVDLNRRQAQKGGDRDPVGSG